MDILPWILLGVMALYTVHLTIQIRRCRKELLALQAFCVLMLLDDDVLKQQKRNMEASLRDINSKEVEFSIASIYLGMTDFALSLSAQHLHNEVLDKVRSNVNHPRFAA